MSSLLLQKIKSKDKKLKIDAEKIKRDSQLLMLYLDAPMFILVDVGESIISKYINSKKQK